MTAIEIDYWAKRLQVPPQHLKAVLQTAFCDTQRAQEVVASTRDPRAERLR